MVAEQISHVALSKRNAAPVPQHYDSTKAGGLALLRTCELAGPRSLAPHALLTPAAGCLLKHPPQVPRGIWAAWAVGPAASPSLAPAEAVWQLHAHSAITCDISGIAHTAMPSLLSACKLCQ